MYFYHNTDNPTTLFLDGGRTKMLSLWRRPWFLTFKGPRWWISVVAKIRHKLKADTAIWGQFISKSKQRRGSSGPSGILPGWTECSCRVGAMTFCYVTRTDWLETITPDTSTNFTSFRRLEWTLKYHSVSASFAEEWPHLVQTYYLSHFYHWHENKQTHSSCGKVPNTLSSSKRQKTFWFDWKAKSINSIS